MSTTGAIMYVNLCIPYKGYVLVGVTFTVAKGLSNTIHIFNVKLSLLVHIL